MRKMRDSITLLVLVLLVIFGSYATARNIERATIQRRQAAEAKLQAMLKAQWDTALRREYFGVVDRRVSVEQAIRQFEVGGSAFRYSVRFRITDTNWHKVTVFSDGTNLIGYLDDRLGNISEFDGTNVTATISGDNEP